MMPGEGAGLIGTPDDGDAEVGLCADQRAV